MGAIAGGGVRIKTESVVRQMGLSEEEIAAAVVQEQLVLEPRERKHRGDRRSMDLAGRLLIPGRRHRQCRWRRLWVPGRGTEHP